MLELEAQTPVGGMQLDVALAVAEGECLALAGPSGAGKTTILRIAAGLARPERGLVACGGATWLDTARGTFVPAEERRCGYVFQEYALFPHLRAWQNVAFPIAGVRSERRRRACELLERFGVAGVADAHPRTLSGGERQRVALARALARRPAALLLDEPLSALDARTRAAATREVAAVLRDAGVPAVLVTHDFSEAAQLGDRVGVVDGGRIVQQGTAGDLAARPATAFVADLTGAVVLTGTATRGAGGLTDVCLDGGGTVSSTDPGDGPVAVSVHPWDIAIEPAGAGGGGSARNRLPARVVAVTVVGSRVRVGLQAGQPLAAEVTDPAVRQLGLAPGVSVEATWKAAATRLVAR